MSLSMRSLARSARSWTQAAIILLIGSTLAGSPASCPANEILSCHNTSAVANSCCFNNNQLLQTQFWDTDPATGPADHWTIHGLWPDNCDGTYAQYCDESRQYTNITAILESYGRTSLLEYMDTFWKDNGGNDEGFWEHEWGKHGTCISTLDPSCYTDYTPQEEVVDFFQRTVDLFMELDTYSFLAAAGIYPSATQNYTSAAVLSALSAPRGVTPIIECYHGQLDEVYYYFDTYGSVPTGQFVPENPVGASSGCPASLQYLPKNLTSAPISKSNTTAPNPPFRAVGNLLVQLDGPAAKQDGCLNEAGSYVTNTANCGTYVGTASGKGFTLQSSSGPCGIVDSIFECSRDISKATVFSDVIGNLGYNGNKTAFYSDSIGSRATVYVSKHANEFALTWEAT